MFPQDHLKYDDFFETVQDNKLLPVYKWQTVAGFTHKGKRQRQEALASEGGTYVDTGCRQ